MKYTLGEKETDKPQLVSLELDADGTEVAVKVGSFYVLALTREGKLRLESSIGTRTGLKLDDRGRIMIGSV